MGKSKKTSYANNSTIIETSKHKKKQVVLDYMRYYGVAIERENRGGVEFYMIRKVNNDFSNNELMKLTNNVISFFEYYIIIPPKTMQMSAYRTLDEAYSALEYLYQIMQNKELDSDF